MRALLFIIVLGPVSVYACAVLCMEFREEIVTGFNGITYKTESKKARELIELEFPSVVELFAILLAGSMSPDAKIDF